MPPGRTEMRLAGALSLACVVALAATAGAQSGDAPLQAFGPGAAAVDVPAMVKALSGVDVVILGATGDAGSSRARTAVVDALAAGRRDIGFAVGPLAQDAQEPLDHFLMGHNGESDVLAAAGPWPDYDRDFKAFLELALRHEWAVVAGGPARASAQDAATADDALAKAVAQIHAVSAMGGKTPLIVVFDRGRPGAVGDGVSALLAARLPGRRVATVSFVRAAAASAAASSAVRADFVVAVP